jgi:hypothetical protein
MANRLPEQDQEKVSHASSASRFASKIQIDALPFTTTKKDPTKESVKSSVVVLYNLHRSHQSGKAL